MLMVYSTGALIVLAAGLWFLLLRNETTTERAAVAACAWTLLWLTLFLAGARLLFNIPIGG